MNLLNKISVVILGVATLFSIAIFGQNQTEELSPVFPADSLPFTLDIEEASFQLPVGIQAYASAIYKGRWIFIGGRTNGLHGFDNVGNNFPPLFQNSTVYIVNPTTGSSHSRSLNELSSGLSITEIDELSTTACEFFQKGKTLYIVGGYGINRTTNQMETKSTLTAIDLGKLVQWVYHGRPSLKKAIRQAVHPIFQVTGGALFQYSDKDPFLLMLGQNFIGLYRDNSNGIYTRQIRSFWLKEEGKSFSIHANVSKETSPDYRRRDLNIVPIIRNNRPAYVAFAGVFTLEGGVWTVPITISPNGTSCEPDPHAPNTFKQAMNHYNCPTFSLYSKCSKETYVVFPGGISYGFFSGDTFETDEEIPFINQVTTIKIDKKGHYTQYLMDGQYPDIPSTGSNPGNQLLFGAEAQFFPAKAIPTFKNGVIALDHLPDSPVVLGYIVGGIMSTLPNTNTASDSTASPYIFTVKLISKE
jgi:hypothetical protein